MPNGAGSVFKLSGNRRKPYTAVMSIGYTDQGVLKRKYIGYYESYPEALHALEMFKEVPYDLENKNITIERLYEILKERKKSVSKRTLIGYRTAYNHLKPLHHAPFRNLRTHDYQKILNDMQTKYESKYQIKTLLNQIYKIAFELDIINKNYATPLDCGTSEKSTMHKAFSLLEIRKLWELSKTYEFAKIPLVLCYTGMRPQELTNVKKTDVNLEKCYLVGGMKTKAGKKRIVPLHKDILPIICKLMEQNKKWLIETPAGRKYSYETLLKHWHEFADPLSLDHLPHDGRHTLGTYAEKKNMNQHFLKLIIGHEIKDITDRVYSHPDPEDLVEAVNKL